ncbi:MAG: hypothetical protein JWR69_2419, partial [Pedosphaera sp.]|nr:hypothetical protein [Pedosphaera sp.]
MLLRCFGGLLLLLMAGCATSHPHSAYRQQLEPGNLTNLLAYRAGTNLLLRFPLPGPQAFAHASWPPAPYDPSGYHHQLTALTFENQARATRRSLMKRSNHVTLRDARQWEQLVQKVFHALAPNLPGHGVVLLVENQEMVLFLDPSGKLTVVKLGQKPPEVVVDRTFNDADFSRQAIQLLRASLTVKDRTQ